MKRLILPLITLCLGGTMKAQHTDITRATLYGVGSANLFDTYLSPQTYKGTELRILRESVRDTSRVSKHLMQQTLFQANVSYTENRAENNNTVAGLTNWNWGLFYRLPLTPNLTILTGGMADVNGGFVYNMRNGNNPVQARAYLNLDASAQAIWKLRIKNYPLTLRYQFALPLMGVMFMPHYGQSYYEIFSQGNSKGVVNFTSLHNQPSLRQMLSVDFPVARSILRMAYVWDAQQSNIHQIKTHAYSHLFMVGFVKQLQLIRPKKH